MKRLEPRLLQRYFDSELGEREHRRVEAHLAECPEDRAAVERLGALAGLMREAGEQQLEHVSFDGFSARVMNGIRRQERPGAMERLGMRLREFAWHQRRLWIPAAAAAGAVAAVLLMLPLLSGAPRVAPLVASDSRIAVFGHAGSLADRAGSEIVSVVGARQWEPFEVTNDLGESMAVAWIRE